MSKEAVTDDFLIVVVSLDCESDRNILLGMKLTDGCVLRSLFSFWIPYLVEGRSAPHLPQS